MRTKKKKKGNKRMKKDRKIKKSLNMATSACLDLTGKTTIEEEKN